MIYTTIYESPLGKMLIASTDKKLIGLYFENQKYYLANIEGDFIWDSQIEILVKTKKWLDRYFRGEKPNVEELDLEFRGSEFRKMVWEILCKIPYGEVVTYKSIADAIVRIKNIKTMSAQAIGNAVGHNPISIIVPCHRVVGTNGNLTGYAGGIQKKIKLLELEGHDLSLFTVPTNVCDG